MSSLLDSRAHHTRIRVLSRKAWENEIYDGEPSHRWHPDTSSNDVEHLSGRQCGQRERRRRERNERIQTVDHGSANDSIGQTFNHVSNTPLTLSHRKQGQQRHHVQKRAERESVNDHAHFICCDLFMFSVPYS